MNKRLSRPAIGLCWLVGFAHAANATAPASPEMVVCAYEQAFSGKVLQATSRDCRLRWSGPCAPEDQIELSVEIDDVLRSTPLPSFVDLMQIKPPAVATRSVVAVVISGFSPGANLYPPIVSTDEAPVPISDDWVASRLVGRRFIFLTGGIQPSNSVSGGRTHVLYAGALPAEAQKWVKGVIDERCQVESKR
jgi:hypothetical protein